ncbi:MAG TPA: serine hydrolase [Steroidobacteraceae bacterium]|jgi:CubicO group peptidase (beta-lactamase class C family)|nr:serine hydrolase [Steroidobacteraceae bacterium]
MLAIAFGAGTAHAASPALAGLDSYVRAAMAQWKVPGLAVAVVKDGRIVIARGYGARELGKPERVDADTLFDIGSNTKAFTAAALGTLVSAGKLRWDDPVVRYVPTFRLESPYVTQEITLRDLLSHRTGYCDPFPMWYFSDDTTGNIIARLQYQKPRYGFRAHFCYNNTMYVVAAQLVPALTGTSWNDYVATHLFTPLGMTRTVSTAAAVAAASDVAAPHGEVDGKVAVIKPYWANNMDVFAAVGGINSSVNDMSHWLMMLLANGSYHGNKVLEPAMIRAMETPQALIQEDSELTGWLRTQTPATRFYTYGLGFFLQDFGGHKLVWHAGDIDGMASALAFVPDEHLAVVALSNLNGNRAPEGVVFHVLQTYLGLPQRDVSAAMHGYIQREKAESDATDRKLAAARMSGSQAPPLPLSAYAGNYSDPLYGAAQVQEEGGHLVLRLGNPMFVGDLQHWNGNTFQVKWRYRFYGKTYITFDVDALDEPARLAFAQLPNQYERAPSGNSTATAH